MPQVVIDRPMPKRAQLTLLSGPRAAHVSPDCDLLVLTAAAWELAQRQAAEIEAIDDDMSLLQQRIRDGETWLRQHGTDDPDHAGAVVLLDRLRRMRDDVYRQLACAERECLLSCRVVAGFVINAGAEGAAIQHEVFGGLVIGRDDPVSDVWRVLLGARPVPDEHIVNGTFVVPSRRDLLRSLLTRWPEEAE